MKLIENPIRMNASLHKMLPYTMRYLYGKINIKYFRLFTLGSVHVYYIEGFKKTEIVMTHDTRKIKQDEIDFVVAKLFPDGEASAVQVDHSAKDEIEGELKHKIFRVKDVVFIEKKQEA